MRRIWTIPLGLLAVLSVTSNRGWASGAPVAIIVDAATQQRAISPMIYGVSFGTAAGLSSLNAPLSRFGGNATSLYNWRTNAVNSGNDWYYESHAAPAGAAAAGGWADAFTSDAVVGGAAAMVTVPMIGRIARLGGDPSRNLRSFSVAKYGAQTVTDRYLADAGNGVRLAGGNVTGNDPNDATMADSMADEAGFVAHMVQRWGRAAEGGVRYYLTDNEASIWHGTHRDVQPVGVHATTFLARSLAMSDMVKAADPTALVAGPEEWSFLGYIYDGYDQYYTAAHNEYSSFPDRTQQQGGVDYVPWLLTQWKKAGHPIDALTLHYYPQGREYGNDVSEATQLLRNRSTRALWDPSYVSEDYNHAKIRLIPRLLGWVEKYYYAKTPIGLTEYSWGADSHINGATTQADILGIFGREGLSLATRWTQPDATTPTFKAFQMYRNYDGYKSSFGDVSVSTAVPDPDMLSAFGALRSSDGALTLMMVNKALGVAAEAAVTIRHFSGHGTAQFYQLTSANKISRLPDSAWAATPAGVRFTGSLPAQSITLAVLVPAS